MLDSGTMTPDSPLYEAVRAHYLFSGLGTEAFASLALRMSPIRVDKGELLFRQGETAESFYFLDEGLIELNIVARNGEKKTLEVIEPGRTFAEAVTFMRGRKYPVSAEAISAAELCAVPNSAYLAVLHEDTDACMRLLADLSRHLHARVSEIENLTIQNARNRLVSYLMDHIEERHGDEATVRLRLPKHVIASRLSIQPETLSRLFRNLSDEGLISAEDRVVVIHSLSRLRLYD